MNSNWSYSPRSANTQFGSKSACDLVPCDLEIRWMTLKNNRAHLLCYVKLCAYHFIAIGEFKLETQSGKTQFGSKLAIFFVPCDLTIWQLTLKNNRTSLLWYFKLCASFHSHWWFQSGVTARKRPYWDNICFDLCDLGLWPLTFTFCMDISCVNGNNSWNFHDHDDPMKRTLWQRCHRRTDRRARS